ncbi:transposable element Tcb1 transposase [Trichonephila clavipes]|nr:transposable element Tcb1 transposase [Trichonephila clavipes]
MPRRRIRVLTSNCRSLKEVVSFWNERGWFRKSENRSSYWSKDVAIKGCWQERGDSGRFQRHDGSGQPRATADGERHTYSTVVRRRYSENCFASVPFAVPWPYLQRDNARPHTARVAMNCLTACKTLPCPASSSDLSPIEHVWDMLKRRLHLRWNFDDLTRQLEQIWQEIPQETIRVLYHPTPCDSLHPD